MGVNPVGHQQKLISDLSVQHLLSPAEPAADGRRNGILQGPGQSGHRMEGFSEWDVQGGPFQGKLEAVFLDNFFSFSLTILGVFETAVYHHSSTVSLR